MGQHAVIVQIKLQGNRDLVFRKGLRERINVKKLSGMSFHNETPDKRKINIAITKRCAYPQNKILTILLDYIMNIYFT